jgi:23S rRNA (pseudouridine1915-N3)-methyltransferase
MKILVASVGKSKPKDAESLIIQEYITRLPWKISLHEIGHQNSKEKESQALLRSVENYYIVTLDQKGEQFSSEEFAGLLNNLQLHGKSNIAFAIGGANGHHQSMLEKSQKIISFGKMTLAHKLAKIILIEQLYRAYTISKGHPYNK